MSSVCQVEILCAEVEFISRKLTVPLVLSSGAIVETTEARASMTVRAGNAEATGRGSIYLSGLWAWPDAPLTNAQRDAALQVLCRTIGRDLPTLCGGEAAHPLELGLRLHQSVCGLAELERTQNLPQAAGLTQRKGSAELPLLARIVCTSPFDAALHDAVGLALGRSAFSFYDEVAPIPSADAMFPGVGASAAIRRMLRTTPRREFPACVVVSKQDDLATHFDHWVRRRGYSHVKLKLSGQNVDDDVGRTVEVFQALRSTGVARPWIIVDTNEANPDADSVLDYLEQLRAADHGAYEALQYLEQPTSRDIRAHRLDWRRVTRLKPVLLDEGLTNFGMFDLAREQGWSGFALKTCKGHSFSLVAAAWSKENGLVCSLQDLTNPGYSALHAGLFAAFVPTLNGVEINSPQFTPDANREWLPRLREFFEPADGVHRLPEEVPFGLGSSL